MMVAIDFIGLMMTMCLAGLRYPHYVLAAAAIHDLGRVMMVFFLKGHIELVIAAGVFGTANVTGLSSSFKAALVILGGPFACYLVSAIAGGVEREKTARLLNPTAILQSPFAVITLRVAILSFLVNIWQLL